MVAFQDRIELFVHGTSRATAVDAQFSAGGEIYLQNIWGGGAKAFDNVTISKAEVIVSIRIKGKTAS